MRIDRALFSRHYREKSITLLSVINAKTNRIKKCSCRDLEHDNAKVTEAVGDNMLVQSHIERLNAEIGGCMDSFDIVLLTKTLKKSSRPILIMLFNET